MIPHYKIALQVEYPDKPDRYYTLRLKQTLANEPSIYSQPKRLFIGADMGDDFNTFTKQLLKRKIIDKYLQWTFGEGHLIILGDRFTQSHQVTECLWLIYSLEEQAKRAGGYVHFILGNYSILQGTWRSEQPKYASKNLRSSSLTTALYRGNNELWHWLHTKNIVEKIGSLLFVRGGIAPVLNTQPYSLVEINQLARNQFSETLSTMTNCPFSFLDGTESPMNFQGYIDGTVQEDDVNATLQKFEVDTIITGGRSIDRIASCYNGKVINVNARKENGMCEGLFINRKQIYRITIEGKKEKVLAMS